jgi:hypothetical protein
MRRAGIAHWNLLRELTANAVRLGLRHGARPRQHGRRGDRRRAGRRTLRDRRGYLAAFERMHDIDDRQKERAPKRIFENTKQRPVPASLTNGNAGDTPSPGNDTPRLDCLAAQRGFELFNPETRDKRGAIGA